MIKNPPSHAGDVGSVPGGKLGSRMPHGSQACAAQLEGPVPQMEKPGPHDQELRAAGPSPQRNIKKDRHGNILRAVSRVTSDYLFWYWDQTNLTHEINHHIHYSDNNELDRHSADAQNAVGSRC